MASCKFCGFNPEEYGYRPDQSMPLGRGGFVSLLTCARCGCSVCSSHCDTGPIGGYGDCWAGKLLCDDCTLAVQLESAAQWEEEYGDSGVDNPYLQEERI